MVPTVLMCCSFEPHSHASSPKSRACLVLTKLTAHEFWWLHKSLLSVQDRSYAQHWPEACPAEGYIVEAELCFDSLHDTQPHCLTHGTKSHERDTSCDRSYEASAMGLRSPR